MKFVFFITLVSCGAAPAIANTLTCSSARQTLAYSHFTSNGGAPLNSEEISFAGQVARSGGSSGDTIDFKIGAKNQLEAKDLGKGTTLTTFSASASGTFTVDGREVSFGPEWVLCEEEIQPICPECP